MATKKITKKEQDKLMAIGLYKIAREAAKTIDKCVNGMASIMKLPGKDDYDRGGWILSDNMWEDDLDSFIDCFEENYKK